MTNLLYRLPEPVVLLLAIFILAVLLILLPRLLQRQRFYKGNASNDDFAIRVQGTLFAITTLVLAFTLVQADLNFRAVDSAISTEAARIDQFDRLLTRYHSNETDAVRPILMAYARSIATEDWSAMLESGSGSLSTRRTFTIVSSHTLAVHPDNTRHSLIYAE